jgi:tyrosine-specific transport protein
MSKKHFWQAVSILIGTIIGAGVLGIPFIVAQAGFLTGLISIIGLGLVMLISNLYLGEITLRTKGNHQLTGYAKKYLGNSGKVLMSLSMSIGIFGAMIAYLLGEGQVLAELFGGSPFTWMIVFFIIMGIITFVGLQAVSTSELVLDIVKLSIFIVIVVFIGFSGKFSLQPLASFSLAKLLIPYGVILFAFAGSPAIPEMREILRHRFGHWREMKKAIILATLIPMLVYVIFAGLVIGVTGSSTTEVATVGLGRALGTTPLILLNVFAALAMATSFIALALALKEMFVFDFGLHKHVAWAITMFIPLGLVIGGIQSFITVIAVTGAIVGGINGVLILIMHAKAKKFGDRKPEFVVKKSTVIAVLFIGLFILGAIVELYRILL